MEIQKKPFRFDDPRQERIHRRLLLVGPGPASFYRDACRLMACSDLQSTTHLVGHLLREIDSALSSVLEPVVDVSAKTKQYKLHAKAHRRALLSPRKLDNEFVEFWNAFNSVLDEALDQFESNYLKSLRIFDELLLKKTPDRGDAKALRNRAPNNPAAFRYFFDKLDNPAWLQPLQEEGLFQDVPGPEHDPAAGTVSYPLWPQSGYLARMAMQNSSSVKKSVFDISVAIEDNGNVGVQHDLVDVALALPADMAEAFVAKAKKWVEISHFHVQDKATDLILHLAQGGRLKSALELATSLFAVRGSSAD